MKADLAKTGIVVDMGKNPIPKMPVIISGNQGTVYIDEIPVVTPVDNVEIANSGGGEQIILQVLEIPELLAATKCESTYYNFKVDDVKIRATE